MPWFTMIDRGVVVLFGGRSTANPQLDDTWEYNGLTWTQVNTPQALCRAGKSWHGVR